MAIYLAGMTDREIVTLDAVDDDSGNADGLRRPAPRQQTGRDRRAKH